MGMDAISFSNKIVPELRKLNKQQLSYFAWLCAIRVLPYAGWTGDFASWESYHRQKYLYAIFHAIDVGASFNTADVSVNTSAYTNAITAYKETNDKAAKAAAYAAAYSAYTTYSSPLYAVAEAAGDAIEAAAYATKAITYNRSYALNTTTRPENDDSKVTSISNKDLESILLQDIKNIQNSEEVSQIRQHDLHSNIWENFQKALEVEGCAFWGRLYQSIFDNGFLFDRKALERRMNVPKEISEQGASAVANFLEELEDKGAVRLNEARIIILGDKGTGKTSLARRLVNPEALMTLENESTAGVDTTVWKLEGENIKVRIWDFAGHTVTHAVHQFFLSERCLYILVYDGRTEDRNRLEYWLNHVKNYGGDSRSVILVNKRDPHSVDIP